MDNRTVALIGGVIAGFALGLFASQAVRRRPPLHTVDALDLERYTGTWYEIARLPTSNEDGCTDVTARYHLRSDGTVTVVNRCLRRGEVDEVEGRAWRPRVGQPGSLRVRFLWPFWGDYNVLDREAYRYALVGTRNRRRAWLLSREPTMPTDVRERFEHELERQGFDIAQLSDTPQG
jgi:apolipoprotein D and lipocalin family protein